MREQGFVKKEVWIRPENATFLSELEKQLRSEDIDNLRLGGKTMTEANLVHWTTGSLFDALTETKLAVSGHAQMELIEGIDSSIHIVMTEFGDLPMYLTVSGEQIIVEAVLWPTTDVAYQSKFNEIVLKTHKYFPLSTISIDRGVDGAEYYHMFGALSASSSLDDIVFEIEVLAGNVIQATEAFREFLTMEKRA